jgi:nitrite reductase/ring-hydroxylating ferredoxin subunit
MWSSQLTNKPVTVKLLGEPVVFVRDKGEVRALYDRCPHRGVPLSYGRQHFPGTLSCPYHGWTFDLETGVLRAVITDGPDSPLCGKVAVETYAVAERLGMVWAFVGRSVGEDGGEVPPIDVAIPEELRENEFTMGGRIDVRRGGWRFAAENGFDEGHAKYLHRNSLWRIMKLMPTWTRTRVIPAGEGWITRVQDEVHWEAHFPGLGTFSGKRWWKRGSKSQVLGASPSKAPKVDPVIAGMNVPGNQSIRVPGLLRIVHPRFIHYEWYVPSTEDEYIYVQLFVQFRTGFAATLAKLRYLLFVRWLFHGQFTGQDRWMVEAMHAPPERLYRPDVSITRWRALCEQAPRAGQAIVSPTAGGSDVAEHR